MRPRDERPAGTRHRRCPARLLRPDAWSQERLRVSDRCGPDLLADIPGLTIVIAGDGDLRDELDRARRGRGAACADRQSIAGRHRASVRAADVIAVPSVRDDAGNVDGLPNFALEALASGTPVVRRVPAASPKSSRMAAPAGSSRSATRRPWRRPCAGCSSTGTMRPRWGPPRARDLARFGWGGRRGAIRSGLRTRAQ
jgi:hypothetical protein